MKIARVEYTVTRTEEDGKMVSVNKERILPELDSFGPVLGSLLDFTSLFPLEANLRRGLLV